MTFRCRVVSSLRLFLWSSLSLSLIVAGCATQNTLAQDLAWERWQKCNQFRGLQLREIRPDGQIWVLYGDGFADLGPWRECLRKAETEQAQRIAVVKAPESITSSSPQMARTQSPAAIGPPAAPVWKVGDEWAFREESPRWKGTFVWSVEREETLGGVEYYVVRSSGEREIYYRKGDLAWHMDKVAGAVEVRAVPADVRYVWPLAVGMRWEFTFTREAPRDRTTEERIRNCEVEREERTTVPAGTFSTLKIVCRDKRTGSIALEMWYGPEVRHWVKWHGYWPWGLQERELIAFRLK